MPNGQPGASQLVHCCKTVKRQFLHETQLLINEVAAVWPAVSHPLYPVQLTSLNH